MTQSLKAHISEQWIIFREFCIFKGPLCWATQDTFVEIGHLDRQQHFGDDLGQQYFGGTWWTVSAPSVCLSQQWWRRREVEQFPTESSTIFLWNEKYIWLSGFWSLSINSILSSSTCVLNQSNKLKIYFGEIRAAKITDGLKHFSLGKLWLRDFLV